MDRVHLADSGIIIIPAGKDAMLICYEKKIICICVQKGPTCRALERSAILLVTMPVRMMIPLEPGKGDSPKITRRES